MPTRFAKELAQIIRGAVAIGLTRTEALRLAIRCARDSTDAVLRTVAATPGAMGYSELGAATGRKDLTVLRIGGPRPPISKEEQERMFEPFFTSATRWTGLSLSIARRIARKHGGTGEVVEQAPVTWLRMTLPLLEDPS